MNDDSPTVSYWRGTRADELSHPDLLQAFHDLGKMYDQIAKLHMEQSMRLFDDFDRRTRA